MLVVCSLIYSVCFKTSEPPTPPPPCSVFRVRRCDQQQGLASALSDVPPPCSVFRVRRCDQQQGLASALSDVIWGARAGGPAHVCLCSETLQVWGDTDYLSDGVTERVRNG